MLGRLQTVAPSDEVIYDYDRKHLLIYAELISADQAGMGWSDGALRILSIDPVADGETARICWESHLARALWIRGAGLGLAVAAFGKEVLPTFGA